MDSTPSLRKPHWHGIGLGQCAGQKVPSSAEFSDAISMAGCARVWPQITVGIDL